jgi:hypothetical protein
MDPENFIVQVEWRTYYVRLREAIEDTPYPSAACHMSYDTADAVCQRIRARGHADSVVCDQRGNPVIARDLEMVRPISEAQIKKFYNEEITETGEAR